MCLQSFDVCLVAFLLYDKKGNELLSKDELTTALSAKGSHGFFNLTDSVTLVECIVEEIFEAANVSPTLTAN
jgi:hypothetical protein